MAIKSNVIQLAKSSVVQTENAKRPGRLANDAYRTREHLTEDEVLKVLAALKLNRYGQRDRLMGLLAFRHGLRVSELIDLQWSDILFDQTQMFVRRLKGSQSNAQALESDELNGLRRLQREGPTNDRYLFVSERGTIFTRDGVLKISSGLARSLACHSRYIRTCSDTRPAPSLPTMVCRHSTCNAPLAIRTLRTVFAIRRWQRAR